MCKHDICGQFTSQRNEEWDRLHIEIDNDADAYGLDPWQALDAWKLGVEKYKEQKV